MNLESSVIYEIKEKQIQSCPSSSKISIVCTGYAEDPKIKSTFYNLSCSVQGNGDDTVVEQRKCYKEIHDFNKELKRTYGRIRFLKAFPSKHLGRKDDQHIQARMNELQKWLNELVADVETCEDPVVREYFQLPLIPKQSRLIYNT